MDVGHTIERVHEGIASYRSRSTRDSYTTGSQRLVALRVCRRHTSRYPLILTAVHVATHHLLHRLVRAKMYGVGRSCAHNY